MVGVYDGATFKECRTGLAWKLDETRAAEDLERGGIEGAGQSGARPDRCAARRLAGDAARVPPGIGARCARLPPLDFGHGKPAHRACEPARRLGDAAEFPSGKSAPAAPRGRRGAGEEPLAFARPLHARPHQRGEELCEGRRHRRGHGRADGGRGHGIEAPDPQEGRPRPHAAGLAALRRDQGSDADRRLARAAQLLPRPARDAGDDRVLRPEGNRPAEAGRDGARLGRVGRGWQRGRPAREALGLPCDRHRRRAREVRLRDARARLRRLPRLQGGQSARRARARPTCTSTTSAARCSTSRSRA